MEVLTKQKFYSIKTEASDIVHTPEVQLWNKVLSIAIVSAMWKKTSKGKFRREEEAYNYLMKDDYKRFNSAINLCELCNRNIVKIRYLINMPPEQQYSLRRTVKKECET